MKKIVFILMALLALSVKSFSQNSSGIYYKGEKLNYSRVIGKSIGNIAGAYFTLGLSSAKSNKIIEGGTSSTEIEENKPEFTFIFGEDKQTGYIFTNIKNIDNMLLVKLHEKKNKRNLRIGKYGLTGVNTGIDENDVIPLSVEKTDENTAIVKVKNKLEKGEYCFYYIGNAPSEDLTFNGVFDFTIK